MDAFALLIRDGGVTHLSMELSEGQDKITAKMLGTHIGYFLFIDIIWINEKSIKETSWL